MHKWIGAGLGLLLAAGAGSVVASTHKHHKAATHKPVTHTEASDAEVRQLMEASGVDRMLGQMNTQMAAMMQQQIPCVPASYWQDFIDAKGVRELTERMVPIYQRHFSAADIQGLLKFYRSPLGRKVITEMPATMAEGMQVGQEWAVSGPRRCWPSCRRAAASTPRAVARPRWPLLARSWTPRRRPAPPQATDSAAQRLTRP